MLTKSILGNLIISHQFPKCVAQVSQVSVRIHYRASSSLVTALNVILICVIFRICATLFSEAKVSSGLCT